MQEFLGICLVTAVPFTKAHKNTDPSQGGLPGYMATFNGDRDFPYDIWYPHNLFEENYVAVDGGTGMALKSVAALAVMSAIEGVPLPANDQPSNAELGVLSDDAIVGIAGVCWDVMRQWRINKGVGQFMQPWDSLPHGQRQYAVKLVTNYVQTGVVTAGPAAAADLEERALYSTIINSMIG